MCGMDVNQQSEIRIGDNRGDGGDRFQFWIPLGFSVLMFYYFVYACVNACFGD